MLFLKTYVRWMTNFSFLLALILTVFLLSGTTSTSPGVRNLYVVKIELNSTRGVDFISSPTASTPGSPAGRLLPVVGTPLSQISSASSLTTKSTINELAPAFVDRDTTDTLGSTTPVASKIPRAASTLDTPSVDDQWSAVVISYFGICSTNTTTNWSCAKKRGQAESLGGSLLSFLKLAGSLQGAISPLPPIIAISLQGSLLILSCFLGFRSTPSAQASLGKLFLALAFGAFTASILTAILFQSTARIIYNAYITSDTIIASKGSSGVALAWSGVFFTSLALAGVITLILLVGTPQDKQNHPRGLPFMSTMFNKGAKQGKNTEMPAHVHYKEGCNPPRRELHPERGNFRPEAPGHTVHSERVEDMRRGNTPFGNGWNMI